MVAKYLITKVELALFTRVYFLRKQKKKQKKKKRYSVLASQKFEFLYTWKKSHNCFSFIS